MKHFFFYTYIYLSHFHWICPSVCRRLEQLMHFGWVDQERLSNLAQGIACATGSQVRRKK